MDALNHDAPLRPGSGIDPTESTDEVVEASTLLGAPDEEAVISRPIAVDFAFLAGGGLLTIGILGLIPPITRGSTLFNIMHVNMLTNIIFIVTGLAGLAVWLTRRKRFATAYAVALGIIYVIVFSAANINFGNLEGTIPQDSVLHTIQWVLYVGLLAAVMISSWLIAALAAMQRGDRATRRVRSRHAWFTWERFRSQSSTKLSE